MATRPLLYLSIGELIISPEPAVISTVLGSCVSVCLYSKETGIGGMIHYALPEAPMSVESEESFRYGDLAISNLVKEMERITGLSPRSFSAKIIGGANELGELESQFRAGHSNIEIAKKILSKCGVPIIGEDVGGVLGRKVLYHTDTGRAQVSVLNKTAGSQGTKPRRVLIVDLTNDVSKCLASILERDKSIKIVGYVTSTLDASGVIHRERPDVVIFKPGRSDSSGFFWLEKTMSTTPLPIVLISAASSSSEAEMMRALELGVVDYIQIGNDQNVFDLSSLICEKTRVAATAKVIRSSAATGVKTFTGSLDQRSVLAIGASTGGTEALRSVMMGLPKEIPPTVIVQHIPSNFSRALAKRLNDLCPFEVKEAQDGDELKSSRALIAPGGKQMKIQRSAQGFCVRITEDAPINRHKPSVDYLFDSVAVTIGSKAVGVILTGMGNDGAQGLLKMRSKGAITIGQDEKSSVVYGMPRVAYEVGAVQKVASLDEIPKYILQALAKK